MSRVALQEIAGKYGLRPSGGGGCAGGEEGADSLQQQLEELKCKLKEEHRKELNIKEGAENLLKATTDRNSLAYINSLVEKSDSRLCDLRWQLSDLTADILVIQGHPSVQDEQPLLMDSCYEDKGDVPPSTTDQRLQSLKKQLNIELKGTENMLQMNSCGPSKDCKLLAEAQLMQADPKAKIDYIRMMMAHLRQSQDAHAKGNHADGTATHGEGTNNHLDLAVVAGVPRAGTCPPWESLKGPPGAGKVVEGTSPSEPQIEDLRHRLKEECTVIEGSKNVPKLYQGSKVFQER